MRTRLLLCAVLLTACVPEYEHRFMAGDCVRIRISGEEGMVVRTMLYDPFVYVRIGKGEVQSSGLLGPTVRDDRAYATITFREFELEACD